MGNKNKAKGTAFETLIVKYLRTRGFKRCFRPALTGAGDSGDVNGIASSRRQAIVQCKNQKKFALSEWLNDAHAQSKQQAVGSNALPVLVVKRPGVGEKNLGETYAVLRLEDLTDLMREAGYA